MACTMLLWLRLGGQVGLARQPLQELRVGRQLRVQHLDGHQPIHAHLPGLVDHAHRPLAELLQQLIAGDLLARAALPVPSPARLACLAVSSPAATSRAKQRLGARLAAAPARHACTSSRVSRPRLTRACASRSSSRRAVAFRARRFGHAILRGSRSASARHASRRLQPARFPHRLHEFHGSRRRAACSCVLFLAPVSIEKT